MDVFAVVRDMMPNQKNSNESEDLQFSLSMLWLSINQFKYDIMYFLVVPVWYIIQHDFSNFRQHHDSDVKRNCSLNASVIFITSFILQESTRRFIFIAHHAETSSVYNVPKEKLCGQYQLKIIPKAIVKEFLA